MRVVCDSSGCCGIKHIRDFYGCDPDDRIRNNSHYQSTGHDEDQSTSEPAAYKNWIRGYYLPKGITTNKELFLAYVAQIKERRPQGMITINIIEQRESDEYCCEDCNNMTRAEWDRTHSTDLEYDTRETDMWDPIFRKEGFTRVDFINSNSSNRICHYTLVYDMED